jgi:hypothetical protein
MNCEINLAIENCLVNFFFEYSFLVEREERRSLVSITRCRDYLPVYSETRILLPNAFYNEFRLDK